MRSSQEEDTTAEPTNSLNGQRCKLSLKDVLQLVSSFLLPMMLGIFTAVITLQQQRVSLQQRLEDRQLAREQREQDLNLSSLLRAQDKEDARLQREQDLFLARQQREEDQRRRIQDLNIYESQRDEQRQQRQQDLWIAQERLNQEKNLTQEQHRIGDRQRAHELDVEQKRYWDRLLTDYMQEAGQLLREYNGTLTSSPLIATLVRIKTLTIVRQLSPIHNVQLLQFLYEAGQIVGKDSLDLSTAQLNNIDLSQANIILPLRNISLAGTRLINVSFDGTDLTGANFSGAYIKNASFVGSILDFVQFSHSELYNIGIDGVSGIQVNFTRADLIDTHINKSKFGKSLFRDATIMGLIIDSTNMYDSDFSICRNKHAIISHSNLERTNFSGAIVDDGIFSYCEMDKSNFFKASAVRISFIHVSMKSSNFSTCQMSFAKFFHVEASFVDFSFTDMAYVNYSSTKVISAKFFRSNLQQATMIDLDAAVANFTESGLNNADLTRALLVATILVKARLSRANVIDTRFHRANLTLADLQNTRISISQLDTAISIRDAQLTRTTYARNPNVISNGNAHYTTSVSRDWNIESGSVLVKCMEKNYTNCVFTTNSKLGAYFVQKLMFFDNKFSHLFSSNQAVLILTAQFGNTTSIGLEWGTEKNGEKRTLNSSIGWLRWRNNISNAYYVGVWVKFAAGATQESNWCDDIFLDIDDGDAP